MKLGLEALDALWRRLDCDLLFLGSLVAGGDYPKGLSPECPCQQGEVGHPRSLKVGLLRG